MEGVQETCDTCDTTVFDVHWTCKKCGFVVCNDCHSRQVAADEAEDQDETKKLDWPLCSAKRQHHSPDDLSLTQIIPQEGKQTASMDLENLHYTTCHRLRQL